MTAAEMLSARVSASEEIRGQALLEAEGARVWYTDSFSRPGQATACWESVDFTILRDGTILAPDSREGGGRTI